MKILVGTGSFLPDIGGIETLLGQLLPLQAEKHDVTLITGHVTEQMAAHCEYKGVPVYRYPIFQAALKQDFAQLLRIRKQIEKQVEEIQPDIIHLQVCSVELMVFVPLCRKLDIPVIATIHTEMGAAGLRTGRDTFFGQLVQEAEWVTAVSEGVLHWVFENFPVVRPKSSVIYNAIQPPTLQPTPLPTEPKRLMFIGRLTYQKGIDILLEAFALLHQRDQTLELWIIGVGDQEVELQQQAKVLGLQDAVTFLGRAHPDEIPSLLNQATVVVMPSRYEGLSLVSLEAASMQRPLVATRVPGVPRVVLDGESGIIVDRIDDADAFAAATMRVLDDIPAATRMGERGRAHVLQYFVLSQVADQYEALYHQVISERPN